MAINFELKVNNIMTCSLGEKEKVVKKVFFDVIGVDEDVSFSQAQSIELDDPQDESFIQFENLTENDVKSWIENSFESMGGVKDCIKSYIENKKAELSLQEMQMPWVNLNPTEN